MALLPLTPLILLMRELLHVLIINPKGLEVHPIGSGHTTIFEMALLIDLILYG